jgi:hypothetical protein
LFRRCPADSRLACGLHTHRLWKSHTEPDSYSLGDSYSHSHADSYRHGEWYADSYSGTAANSVTASASDTGASTIADGGSERSPLISL